MYRAAIPARGHLVTAPPHHLLTDLMPLEKNWLSSQQTPSTPSSKVLSSSPAESMPLATVPVDWSTSLPLCLPIIRTLFFFLFIYFWPCLATCGISFPTRDRTSAPCTGSSKPWPLEHQGSPPDSPASPPTLWFLLLSPLLALPAPAPRCQPFSVVGQWPSSLSLNIPLDYLDILWLPLSFENYKKHS